MNQPKHEQHITRLETELRKAIREKSGLLLSKVEFRVEPENPKVSLRGGLMVTINLGDLTMGEYLSMQEVANSNMLAIEYLNLRAQHLADKLLTQVIKEGIDSLTTNDN